MNKEKLIIVGCGKAAVHVLDFIRFYQLYDVVGFAVHAAYRKETEFEGLPVYNLETLREECPETEFKVFVAMMWNHLNAERKAVYRQCREWGYEFANLIAPTAVIRGQIVGGNCWIHDYVVIQVNAKIHSDTFIMAYSLVGGTADVGEHCFLAARSTVAGGCKIGEQCFIGLSATIFDKTLIGRKCIIGACCAVKRNLPDFTRCVTASDACVMKQYTEDEVENKLVSAFNKR